MFILMIQWNLRSFQNIQSERYRLILSMMLALHLAKPNAKLYVIANVIFSLNCFSPMLRGRCKVGPHFESVGRVFLAENSYLGCFSKPNKGT